jgi:hypothetical protein
MVDGVYRGGVCSQSEQERLFHQYGHGFTVAVRLAGA